MANVVAVKRGKGAIFYSATTMAIATNCCFLDAINTAHISAVFAESGPDSSCPCRRE